MSTFVVVSDNDQVKEGPGGVLYPAGRPLAAQVTIDATYIHVRLKDGRIISVPIQWFPRLRNATEAQRQAVEIWSQGSSLHWSALDEDLSVAGFLGHAD
jgi:hypothetical protein